MAGCGVINDSVYQKKTLCDSNKKVDFPPIQTEDANSPDVTESETKSSYVIPSDELETFAQPEQCTDHLTLHASYVDSESNSSVDRYIYKMYVRRSPEVMEIKMKLLEQRIKQRKELEQRIKQLKEMLEQKQKEIKLRIEIEKIKFDLEYTELQLHLHKMEMRKVLFTITQAINMHV